MDRKVIDLSHYFSLLLSFSHYLVVVLVVVWRSGVVVATCSKCSAVAVVVVVVCGVISVVYCSVL